MTYKDMRFKTVVFIGLGMVAVSARTIRLDVGLFGDDDFWKISEYIE